jgi:hypothetical protein
MGIRKQAKNAVAGSQDPLFQERKGTIQMSRSFQKRKGTFEDTRPTLTDFGPVLGGVSVSKTKGSSPTSVPIRF